MSRKRILGLSALVAASMSQPAFATPPPPAHSNLNEAVRAMDRFTPILGNWALDESYTDVDGLKTNNHIELKATRIEYVVYISVTYNGALDQFYAIKYDPVLKNYRIFLSGPAYMGGNPIYDTVDLSTSDNGFSWERPAITDGKVDQSQALAYSIVLSGNQLTETEDSPSWPPPKRIKRTYTFQRH